MQKVFLIPYNIKPGFLRKFCQISANLEIGGNLFLSQRYFTRVPKIKQKKPPRLILQLKKGARARV